MVSKCVFSYALASQLWPPRPMNSSETMVNEPGTAQASAVEPRLELMGSRHFPAWLAEQKIGLAFTTYQAGKLFLIGLQSDGRLSVFERTFNRCMGLWGDGQSLWMSSLYQLWRFENVLEPDQTADGYDRLFVPQIGYITGMWMFTTLPWIRAAV